MRGWVVSPIVGTGTDLDPYRPQVMDRPAVDGDRLDIVIGAADRCLVAAEVSVDNFAQHGGLVLCLEDDFDAPFSSLPPPVRNALNRIGGTGTTIRERVRSAGLLLDPNFHEGKLLGNTAAPPTGSFVDDTFTDTDGVFLPAHTPSPTGTSWTKPSYAATDLRFVSNRLRPNGNGTLGICYATPAAAGPEQVVEAVVRIVSNPAGVQVSTGISGRRSTTTDDGYDLYVNKDTADVATILMRKRVAAASTILASYATTHTISSDVTIKLSMWDSVKRFYVNGTERGSSTDNVHTGTGVVAAFAFQGSGVGDAVGYHIDSFVATDLAAPTYPTVAGTTEGGLTSAGQSFAVTLPAGGSATDEYIVIIARGTSGAPSMNALTGWTELLDEAIAGGLTIERYTGAGVPSDPTFQQSVSTRAVWCAYRISGADKTITPQIGTTATGSSTTPDPPSVSVTGGPKDVLAIACFSNTGAVEVDDTDILVTTFPTGYTLGQVEKTGGLSGTNLAGCLGSAARQVAAASSEDPGTFTQNGSRGWRAQTIVFHPAPSALNLSATGGAATASGGTVALAATWTAATGTATAAGGTATASTAGPPVDLSVAAGLATAAGGVVTLERTSVAATGAATAAGGTVVLASVRVAASGVATAAGGTVALATSRAAAAGVATAGGGALTLAASLVAAGGTSAATGGAATATTGTGVSVTATNGTATAAGGTVLLSAALLATSGVATASGGTVGYAKAVFFSAAGGVATASGSAGFAPAWVASSGLATTGGVVSLAATRVAATGLATAAGGTVTLARTSVAAAGVATAVGGTVNANIGAGVTVTAVSGLATAGGGTLTQARQHVAAAGVASASGGVVTAGAGAALSAANGLASAAGGTVNLTVGQLGLSATGGTATATGTAPALTRTHLAASGVASAGGGAVDIAAAGTVNVSAVSGTSTATGGLVAGTWRFTASGGAAGASGGTVVRTSLAAGGVANATGGAVAARLVYTSTVGYALATGGTVNAAGAAFIPPGLIEGSGGTGATVDGSGASSVTGSTWGVNGTVDGTGTAGTIVDGTGGVPVLVE